MDWGTKQALKDAAVAKSKLKDELKKLNGEWIVIHLKQKKIIAHDQEKEVVMNFVKNYNDPDHNIYVEFVD